MALVKCKECEQEISKKAAACPNCGAPRETENQGLLGLVAVAVVGYGIYSMLNEDSSSGTTGSTQETPSGGTIAVGPINWRGDGHEYARASITYSNTTNSIFETVTIQCTAIGDSGKNVSTHTVNLSTRLGHPSISPGFNRTEEGVFRNGASVKDISCQFDKLQLL